MGRPSITGSVDVTKIDKELIPPAKPGKTARYMRLAFFERPDDYGNAGFIAQDTTVEQRKAGKKGPIIGNWKWADGGGAAAPASSGNRPPAQAADAADIDF